MDQVRKAGDSNRLSLGFFPNSVYDEFWRNDLLYVLVERGSESLKFAGHLLFDQRYPRAHVRQMFTHPDYRRCGVAKRLINHLRISLTAAGFTSIYARVAEDLCEANAFWASEQFHVQNIKDGGAVRKRQIVVRCHELSSPQLFPPSGISSHNPLGLLPSSTDQTPIFLLDLNVLFDVTGPRRKRHDVAVSLFQAERMNVCRLAISKEIRDELHRTAESGKLDPMEGFIDILPSFPLKSFGHHKSLFQHLKDAVFLEKNPLSENDKSDLRHIATAIQHGLAGLITNDSTVLAAAPKIKEIFHIEIISPEAFKLGNADTNPNYQFYNISNISLCLHEIADSESITAHTLLSKLNIPGPVIATEWLATSAKARVAIRFGVWGNNELVGFLTWSGGGASATISARIAVDDAHPAARDAARLLLICLIEQIPQQGPRKVTLDIPPHQPTLRELANILGFRSTDSKSSLHKVVAGSVLTRDSWPDRRTELVENSNLKLPQLIPDYQNPDQQIPVFTPDGNQAYVPLDLLESLLSPVLLCLPGRPAVITPIQRRFADQLLGHTVQKSLLPYSKALSFADRHFLCTPRALKHFKRGTLILFYESSKGKGQSAIMWIARVRQAYHKVCTDLDGSDFENSVMTKDSLSSIGNAVTKTIVVFDNVFKLTRAVPLSSLQQLGCGNATKLLTTNAISDNQLQEILSEAFRSG